MGAKREKGKIPRGEWPAIVARSSDGESLASIARRYNCTAPAIRYIVKRSAASQKQPQDGPRIGLVGAKHPSGARAIPNAPELVASGAAPRGTARFNLDAEIYERVTSDIASFLVLLDAAVGDPGARNLESLRLATDRLMRAAARTRLELERVDAAKVADRAGVMTRKAGENF
jgi:hypothetical protein